MSINSRTLIKNLRKQEKQKTIEDTEINKLIHEYRLADIHEEMDKFKDILKEYHIDDFYKSAVVYNHKNNTEKEQTFHSYHNIKHVNQVLLNCYEGSVYEKLSRQETRCLLVAAMFHDAEHSLGEQSDDYNIARAIDFLKHINLCNIDNGYNCLNETDLKLTTDCIRYTRYPYIDKGRIPKKDECKPFRIIRDADLMTVYNYKTSMDLYQGLFNELREQLNVLQFMELQREFLSKVEWNTQWAKKKAFIRNYPQQIKNLDSELTLYLKD